MEENKYYLTLIELLANYDMLLDKLQKHMAEGHFNLSRANYHNKDSISGTYGKDYWDNTFVGTQFATIDEDGSVASRYVQQEVDTDDAGSGNEVTGDNDNELRNRNTKKSITKEKKRQLDPLSMFGGILSIPNSLCQSQAEFVKCIPIIVSLVNCRKQLYNIIDEIEGMQA
ncbi:HBR328Wp [Eremothecium sinecaudum]|uniref:Vacuolar ATPase assembly protein VMA22 n=1 Tax=Eremothecium sinecaudum TaxID=45286 RepID=A0A120K1C0_9SACH|nr:HBR328Wp [Eremothecium sinecaudum]AMD19229.1 HBR328Wp [Eremothecium sinecaudum]